MAVTLLGTPSPIHLIGESHTLIFRNLLFRTAGSEQLFQTRTRYLPHVLAQNFCDPAVRAFHQDLLEAFRAEELLRPDLSPAHHSLDGSTISGAWMEKRAVVAPAVVLCIGDLDIHHLLSQFADYDFELPDDVHYGVDRDKRPVAYATIRAHMEKLLSPFTEGLRLLRAFGFTRMVVHCVPPRTPDDAATLRWTKVHKSVRAKLTVIANQFLARECAAIGIPFIDVWPELCKDGYLRPEFDLDGTHLTVAAAQVALDKIVASLRQHTWDAHNVARYQHAAAQAPRHAQAIAVERPLPGVSIGQLDAPAQTLQSLEATSGSYRALPELAPRLDWVSAPAAGRAALLTAQPSEEQLALAAKLLGQGVGQAVLHGDVDYAMTVSSFRPSRIAAGSAPQVLAHAAQSSGVRKAVLRLGGAGIIGFASIAGETVHVMGATPGTLAVYDPAATLCTVDPTLGDISLVEIALMPLAIGHPFRVVWSGLHEWPLDPFQYGVAGMAAAPPFDGQQVTVRALAMA
ncbi:hypothetical protein Jab_2c11570 [Janthinobacterium sp. HH01]|uniref:hypothetical protein n=1 Tax=Janthinobacterium sp. HH01 TaxID=1198452 RepID=UPI0002AECD2A|nr:hypothetical protein [Janthinobacterium sp. HH01]ELX09097.1 hypothetical protein Jab_2c11570 [Janthinobacterium sp. HH01]